jgi:TM2 domain-containing membrane protein YozV
VHRPFIFVHLCVWFLFLTIFLMDEQIPNFKHRRRPFLAAFLSFIAFGLGYIYCGRIVKGFVVAFIVAIFIPVITFVILTGFSRINIAILVVSILISLLIWLLSAIDSYYIAKHSKPDYELKEYNRWYVYFIFYSLVTISSKHIALNAKLNSIEA